MPTGERGATGTTGQIGLPGLEGPAGERGLPGLDGLTGATGLQGVTGLDGVTGATGLQGLLGPTGPTGLPGVTGLIGPTGPLGLPGLDGLTGATGQQGLEGVTGPQGLLGPTGSTGLSGAVPSLFASMPAPQTISGNTVSTLTGWDEQYDPENVFNPVSGTYTAPKSGPYEIDAGSVGGPISAVTTSTQPSSLVIRRDATSIESVAAPLLQLNTGILTINAPLSSAQVFASTVVSLAQGGTVDLRIANPSLVNNAYAGQLKITPLP